MTFSIVARCPRSGQFGIAAATGVPAVGKLLTHAAAGIGAVATQARLNPYLGIDGLALLREGLPAAAVLERLRQGDPGREQRQVGLVDAAGRAAAWTGEDCLDWAGHRLGAGYAVQGNRLAGPEVLDLAAETFEHLAERPLSERLIAALACGDEAGGDSKGERSATLYLVDSEEYPLWDIRVDDHTRPIAELKRLYGVFEREVIPHIRRMPTRAEPGGSEDAAVV